MGRKEGSERALLFALGAALGVVSVPLAQLALKQLRKRRGGGKVKLGYWKIRGLAQQIRMVLEFTHTPYEDVFYEQGDAPEYSRAEWFNVKHTLGLPFANIPYIIDGDLRLTQSMAIMRHFGRQHGLVGHSEEEAMAMDLILEEVTDFRREMVTLFYGSGFEAKKDGFISGKLPERLEAFEKWMAEGQGGAPRVWAAGCHLTLADFALYDVVDNARIFATACLDTKPYRHLKDFMNRFESIPEVAAYMASPRYMNRPLNNKVANFK